MLGRPICAAIAVFGAGREVISQGLEGIPHLQPHFVNPAQIDNGVYATPQVPGSCSDLKGVRPGA